MSDTRLSEYAETATGKSARTADIFRHFGSDPKANLHHIVCKAREILDARSAYFLPFEEWKMPVTDGPPLPPSVLSALRHRIGQDTDWCADQPLSCIRLPAPSDGSPENGASNNAAPFFAATPVDGSQRGMLVMAFDEERAFTPEDLHTARCLSGAIALQCRLGASEQIVGIARRVAHDLNNILAALVSYPELILLQLDEKPPLKDAISLMHEAGLSAAELVRGFLDLARPRPLQENPIVNPADQANAFCRTPAYTNIVQAYPKVRFSFSFSPDLPRIRGPEDLISKLLIPPLHHAAQNVTGAGQVTATLRQGPHRQSPNDGDGLTISISDNGPALGRHEIARLFEPFYPQKCMQRKGSGLELAVLQKQVDDLGGTIRVSGDPDTGNRFEIFLPHVAS